MTSSAPGSTRLVSLSSRGHRLSPIRFHEYTFERKEIPPKEQPDAALPECYLAEIDGYLSLLPYG